MRTVKTITVMMRIVTLITIKTMTMMMTTRTTTTLKAMMKRRQ